MKVAGYVTIKLNSERVPHKNIRMLGSHPLCWHIVNTLLTAKNIDEVYVYCSNDKVMEYLPQGAVFLKRDKKLDGSQVKAREIYDAFTDEIDADIYVAACTTSPFTRVESVENAVEKILSQGYDSAFSAKREQTFAWFQGKPVNYTPEDVPRTQDLEPVYIETSAFFAFRREIWKKYHRRIGYHPYIQEVGEIEAIDIDTMEDFEFAEQIADHVCKI